MIYSPQEYADKFLVCGKKVSVKTIIRRCEKGMLPSGHNAKKLSSGGKGIWIIEVPEEVEVKPEKQEEPKTKRSLSTAFINWR